MTSLFPPFNRRTSFRKQPYFFEAGRGVYYKSLGYSSPALNLNFTTGTLDSRITFSRGTNATLTDSTGKITYAPANLILRSQEFDNASWDKLKGGTGSTPTVSQDTVAAPDGTLTADTIVFNKGSGTTANDYSVVRNTVGITTPALSYVSSFYIRAASNCNVTAYLNTGSVVYNNIAVTTSWQRISFVTAAPAGASVYLSIGLVGNDSTGNSSATVYLWGAQLEPVTYQTTPSTYVATTASAYYGPRFDYDPITLQCKGLLIEEQRTNFMAPSNAVTAGTGTTVTANAAISPDGTSNAYRIAKTDATTPRYTTRSTIMTSASTTTYTVSAYFKYDGYDTTVSLEYNSTTNWGVNWNVIFAVASTGVTVSSTASATATATNVGNGWYLCTATFTTTTVSSPTNPNILTRITGASGVTVLGFGGQIETGAFATSYIPTTTATVVRNADVASMTGSNFSSWYNASAGSFFAQGDIIAANTISSSALVGPNSSSYLPLYLTATAAPQGRTWDGTNAPFTTNTVSANTSFKLINAYGSGGLAVCLNAGTVASSAYSGGFSAMAAAYFGSGNTGTALYLNGHIASIVYYNKRLPNATLQQLTLPSLVPSMSLVFDTSSNSYIDANWSP